MEALVSVLQSIYTVLGFSVEANIGDVLGVLSILYVLLASMTHFVVKDEPSGDVKLPEKDFSENISDKKNKGALEKQKTSISPMNAREDKIYLKHTKNLENIELMKWWILSEKKIKKFLNPLVSSIPTCIA